MEALRNVKHEDDHRLAERAQKLTELIEQLRLDLGHSLNTQREAIESLGSPTANAQVAAQNLLLQLEQLQSRVAVLLRSSVDQNNTSISGV